MSERVGGRRFHRSSGGASRIGGCCHRETTPPPQLLWLPLLLTVVIATFRTISGQTAPAPICSLLAVEDSIGSCEAWLTHGVACLPWDQALVGRNGSAAAADTDLASASNGTASRCVGAGVPPSGNARGGGGSGGGRGACGGRAVVTNTLCAQAGALATYLGAATVTTLHCLDYPAADEAQHFGVGRHEYIEALAAVVRRLFACRIAVISLPDDQLSAYMSVLLLARLSAANASLLVYGANQTISADGERSRGEWLPARRFQLRFSFSFLLRRCAARDAPSRHALLSARARNAGGHWRSGHFLSTYRFLCHRFSGLSGTKRALRYCSIIDVEV